MHSVPDSGSPGLVTSVALSCCGVKEGTDSEASLFQGSRGVVAWLSTQVCKDSMTLEVENTCLAQSEQGLSARPRKVTKGTELCLSSDVHLQAVTGCRSQPATPPQCKL